MTVQRADVTCSETHSCFQKQQHKDHDLVLGGEKNCKKEGSGGYPLDTAQTATPATVYRTPREACSLGLNTNEGIAFKLGANTK